MKTDNELNEDLFPYQYSFFFVNCVARFFHQKTSVFIYKRQFPAKIFIKICIPPPEKFNKLRMLHAASAAERRLRCPNFVFLENVSEAFVLFLSSFGLLAKSGHPERCHGQMAPAIVARTLDNGPVKKKKKKKRGTAAREKRELLIGSRMTGADVADVVVVVDGQKYFSPGINVTRTGTAVYVFPFTSIRSRPVTAFRPPK